MIGILNIRRRVPQARVDSIKKKEMWGQSIKHKKKATLKDAQREKESQKKTKKHVRWRKEISWVFRREHNHPAGC